MPICLKTMRYSTIIQNTDRLNSQFHTNDSVFYQSIFFIVFIFFRVFSCFFISFSSSSSLFNWLIWKQDISNRIPCNYTRFPSPQKHKASCSMLYPRLCLKVTIELFKSFSPHRFTSAASTWSSTKAYRSVNTFSVFCILKNRHLYVHKNFNYQFSRLKKWFESIISSLEQIHSALSGCIVT